MKQEKMNTYLFCSIIGLAAGAITGLLGSSYLPYFLVPLLVGLFIKRKATLK